MGKIHLASCIHYKKINLDFKYKIFGEFMTVDLGKY